VREFEGACCVGPQARLAGETVTRCKLLFGFEGTNRREEVFPGTDLDATATADPTGTAGLSEQKPGLHREPEHAGSPCRIFDGL